MDLKRDLCDTLLKLSAEIFPPHQRSQVEERVYLYLSGDLSQAQYLQGVSGSLLGIMRFWKRFLSSNPINKPNVLGVSPVRMGQMLLRLERGAIEDLEVIVVWFQRERRRS